MPGRDVLVNRQLCGLRAVPEGWLDCGPCGLAPASAGCILSHGHELQASAFAEGLRGDCARHRAGSPAKLGHLEPSAGALASGS